jgi:Tol biopolymer transport system component
MKHWILWICLIGALPFLVLGFLFISGGLAFTPLGSLFGDRWHYNGGMGFGRIAPMPNQSAIIYSSSHTGVSHIYLVPWNGGISRQLTNDPGGDSDAAISPDGTQIAFVRQNGDSTHLWLMNTNGTGQHQITFGPDSQTQPCFAPHGKQIAYVNSPRYGIWQIWLVTINGKGAQQLTNPTLNDADTCPVFDKTGKTIFYSHYSDTIGRLQIYAVNVSGAAPSLIGFGTLATVSPNGSQIAFYDQPQNQTLGIMNTNGSGRRIVKSNFGYGSSLAFCPNGLLLTYSFSQSNKGDFITVNLTTGATQTVAAVDTSSH